MKDLIEIRNQIDKIDDQIIELYKERMALSKEVGLIKKSNFFYFYLLYSTKNTFSTSAQR